MRGNRTGPSALSGLRPGPHGGCAPATPSEKLKNLFLESKNKGGLAASFAPAFRLILQLENASRRAAGRRCRVYAGNVRQACEKISARFQVTSPANQ